MENQHRKIKGYRELSQTEIDLMNKIKEKGVELGALVDEVFDYLNAEVDRIDTEAANSQSGTEELERWRAAEPHRWAHIAKTDLQTGIMSLIRSIAQPGTF